MPGNLKCPYKNICRHFPNCPEDYNLCRFFLEYDAMKDMEPARWKPDIIK